MLISTKFRLSESPAFRRGEETGASPQGLKAFFIVDIISIVKYVKTVKCKIEPTQEQAQALLETTQVFAKACNDALKVAIEHNTANKIKLQKLCYYSLRERYDLQANLTIQAIRRVAGAYKAAKAKKRKPKTFKPTSASYDQRTFSLHQIKRPTPEFEASLSTVQGRVKGIPLKIGNYQRHLLTQVIPKGATLTRTKTGFYLNIILEWDIEAPSGGGRVIGVDLGINNLATTSHGMRFPGGEADNTRGRYSRLRSALDAKGTRSASRTLNRSKRKEQRWMRDRNHIISRRIVDSLKPGDAIAFEDLTHIRERTTVRKDQRRRHHSWAFRQLQQFIEYKALERGIAVVYVDPRNTSKSCSRCGAIGLRTGHSFSCACGYRNNSDYNGAYNIAARGHALVARLSSCSPKATPVEDKAAFAELRPRASASPRL